MISRIFIYYSTLLEDGWWVEFDMELLEGCEGLLQEAA